MYATELRRREGGINDALAIDVKLDSHFIGNVIYPYLYADNPLEN